MTLLEALAALVILGTTTVGFLELFHTTARVTRDASEWANVTSYAESVMEATKLGDGDGASVEARRGVAAQVDRRAWAPGVTEIVVVVTAASGRRLELRRLTRHEAIGQSPGTPR